MIKILIFILLVLADFITKYFVSNNLLINQQIKINYFLDLVYVQNFGISFGLLSGSIPYWLLAFIAFIVLLIIFYLFIKSNNFIEKIAYFAIISGAFSNIIDRTINGFVVDFISLHYRNFFWPSFNLADIYITIGIIMLLLNLILVRKK